jgi:hypothetical protein
MCADDESAVRLELADARVRLHVTLPTGWVWQLVPKPARVARDGAVPGRLEARSDADDARLYIGASYLPLASGLAPAVVYWCSLYGLDMPDTPTRWRSHEAFTADSTASARHTRMIWFRFADSVIELRIEAATQAACEGVSEWLRQNLECEGIGCAHESAPECDPWWVRVKKLREAGMLDEALAVAERDGDRAEALLVQAELHADRMHRAQAAGQLDIAREAWRKANGCAYAYAASATSGGEGAACSAERDRLLVRLGAEPT